VEDWLYWSKPRSGLIVGVIKYEANEEFQVGGIGARIWNRIRYSTNKLSAIKKHENFDDHKWSFM